MISTPYADTDLAMVTLLIYIAILRLGNVYQFFSIINFQTTNLSCCFVKPVVFMFIYKRGLIIIFSKWSIFQWMAYVEPCNVLKTRQKWIWKWLLKTLKVLVNRFFWENCSKYLKLVRLTGWTWIQINIR